MIKKVSQCFCVALGLLACAFLFAEESKDTKDVPLMCALSGDTILNSSAVKKPADELSIVSPENCKLVEQKEPLFSLSSEDLDPSESLNRISGEYESEYLPEDYLYKSKNHGHSDPLHGRSYEEVS